MLKSNCYFEMIIYVASVMLKSIAIEYINYFEMVIRCLDDPYDPSTEKQSLAMQVQSSSFNGGGRGKSQFPNKGRGRAGFNGGRGRGGLDDGDDTRVCTHCGKNNHIVQNCFVKYGYPPGFQHKNNKAYVNHAANFASEQTSTQETAPSTPSLNTIQEQYQQIIHLLQNNLTSTTTKSPQQHATANSVLSQSASIHSISSPQMGKQVVLWIMDTGATDHITHSLQKFTSYKNISPFTMALPNGHKTIATISGTVKISSSITLSNVYYIPSFNVNLISATKLLASLDCHITFHPNKCLILQNSTKKMIVTAERHGDLYALQAHAPVSLLSPMFSCNSISNNMDSASLWHCSQDLEPITLSPNETNIPNDTNIPTDITPNNAQTPNDTNMPNDTTPTPISPVVPAPIRQSTRIKNKPSYLQDYHCSLLTSSSPSFHQKQPTVFPLFSVLTYE
ncbi:unnamed protein product [Trifolium pratense]|uniref:Uncharacterized protein n=1 Tax=Trifolium pratense TaxID=57577 RepID=A0ACB0JN93_TRIPR|nr:unnamed protein product [Trifolium pratense]